MTKEAKITSKGQITIPIEIRNRLGVKQGDRILFEADGKGIRVRAIRKTSALEKYRGIGTPGIGEGREAVIRWVRELRGRGVEAE